MSALGLTLGSFALILVLARVKVPLSVAIFIGAATLGSLFGLRPPEVLSSAWAGLIRPDTIGLVVITALLLALSATMQASGQLEQIVSLAKGLFRRPTVTMAALPALIGLLPMPGGALFSAPMVESAAGSRPPAGEKLSAINYWFRHIWEHWWPLYPGVMLAMTLTGSDWGTFAAFQLPLGLSMAASGLLILRGMHKDLHLAAPAPPPGTRWQLVRVTSSIWVVVLLFAAGTLALRLAWGAPPLRRPGDPPLTAAQKWVGVLHKFGPIIPSLLISLLWTARLNRLDRRAIRRVLTQRRIYTFAILVASVMVFQHMLREVDTGRKIAAELERFRVPGVIVVAALPFIAGIVTGLAIGFVGTGFPIVLPLAAAMADGGSVRPYAVMAYAFGHLGQMMSPLHLCHVVSNRYFKTGFAAVYRQIVPSGISAAALAVAYFLVLRAALN